MGRGIYQAAPPIPAVVQGADGKALFTGEQIRRGQQAWLASGGQIGHGVGHGSYVAPDWSADWLHREALALREGWARQRFGMAHARLDVGRQGMLDAELRREMRANGYDAASGKLTLSVARAAAVRETARYYQGLYSADPAFDTLREQYAMTADALPSAVIAWRYRRSCSGPPPPVVPAKRACPIPTTGRTSRWSATRPPPPTARGPSPA